LITKRTGKNGVKKKAKGAAKGAATRVGKGVGSARTRSAPPRAASRAKANGGGARSAREAAVLESRIVALATAEAALDKKALNVEIIDVRGKVDYADYVVVMSGRSERQVSAIARGIEEALKKNHGIVCAGVEGVGQGSWVLMDFGDVIVHVFHEDSRGYYDLESLWIDAARVDVDDQVAE
jgi:ribosome-associated protein